MNPSNDDVRGPLTLQVMGGLGNQMFIAAFGIAASQRFQRSLRFDVSFGNRTAAMRQLELPGLDAIGELARGNDFTGLRRLFDAGCARARVSPPSTFVEHGALGARFGYDASWTRAQHAKRARGYFQSWRYFEGLEESVRANMSRLIRCEPGEQLLAEVRAQVGSEFIAMHVRRGDYLTQHSRTNFGLCSPRYYSDALHVVRSLGLGTAPLVLFTDSPEKLPAELAALANYVVPADSMRTPRADLYTLAQSSAIIMSNSSFSWWGGFLNDSALRPVIAPRPWFRRGDFAGADLLLHHWLTVGA